MPLACNIDAAGKAYRFRAGLVLLAVAEIVMSVIIGEEPPTFMTP